MGIKNTLYYWAVYKNENIRREYEEYIRPNYGRIRSWLELVRLNIHYRVLRKKTPLSALPVHGASARDKRSPYLNGSESKVFSRKEAIWSAKELSAYDVISFDIFDTLILRPFSAPADLFMVVGEKLGIEDYSSLRTEAEREARAKSRRGEVTIYDIYDIISHKTGIDREQGIQTEFRTELEFCFANPYMLRVFNILREQNKEIIIVSDMYYPHDMMKRLLASCGFDGYARLYVSCDHQCGKHTGGLYKKVLADLPDKRIVHVGDNVGSDINSARKSGLDAVYYKNCHEIGEQYRPGGMSEPVGSYYRGIVNTHLHNGVREYSPYYEYGFIYGGIFILGYCCWIYDKAKSTGADKVIFLAPDGQVYQQIFNMLFGDMPNECILWSAPAEEADIAGSTQGQLLAEILRDHSRIVAVGSSDRSAELAELKRTAEEKCKPGWEITCCLVRSPGSTDGESRISCYLDDRCSDIDLNDPYFRLFTQTSHPSFAGITEEGEYVFSMPETSALRGIDEVHEGIIDFCRLYAGRAGSYQGLLSIPGCDACRPFSAVVKSPKFLRGLFPECK